MELLKSDLNSNLEHKTNKETISSIIDEIFLICKNDRRFINYDQVKKLDEVINILKEKDDRHNKLLENSKTIDEDFNNKLKDLDIYITNTTSKLLESLGSEIWL